MTTENKAPERIYLPRNTDSDSWNILAKNPSRDWSTGAPADNIEYVRHDLVSSAPAPELLSFVKKVVALGCSRTMAAEGDVCGYYEREVENFCAACHAETLLNDEETNFRAAPPVTEATAQECPGCVAAHAGSVIYNERHDEQCKAEQAGRVSDTLSGGGRLVMNPEHESATSTTSEHSLRPSPSEAAAVVAAEELGKRWIDPYAQLLPDWKEQIAAIISKHLRATPTAPSAQSEAATERRNALALIERFQREPNRSQATVNALEWLRRQIEEGNHTYHKFEEPTTGFAKPEECQRCGMPGNALMHLLAKRVGSAPSTEAGEPE